MDGSPGLIRRIGIALAAAAVLTSGSTALAAEPSHEPDEPAITVAVSTPIVADIVARAAGPRAEVWSVVPSGADPHTFEATPSRLIRIGESDLFVLIGLGLERFNESGAWRRAVEDADVPVLTLSDQLDLIVVDQIIDHGSHVHDLRQGDPHVWLDPAYARDIATLSVDEIKRMDPEGMEQYEESLHAYLDRLDSLESELDDRLSTIPIERRKLVTNHDAFRYFARRFDFETIGYVTPTNEQHASARDVADLIEVIRSSGVPAVFSEPQSDDRILRTVADETGIEVGQLLTDTLTEEVDSYEAMMRGNVETIVRLLGAED